ncbi:MAG: cobalamin-independent methionine synthase II family protein [Alphaproteobacteria bacterium]|nr:cobalamin-independent methionine synthase II family protein [Alphaproteobacteria bacterium]
MGLETTCIGAFPKPDYVTKAGWREDGPGERSEGGARGFAYVDNQVGTAAVELLDRATGEAVRDQVACGIDIPTDGEQRRENYIYYHCHHLNGIDFTDLSTKVHRSGAAIADLPTVTGKVEPKGGHFLDRDFRVAQGFTDKPLKITVPGPMTIIDTIADTYYGDEAALARDLAGALNFEIRALAEAGCRFIQIDEPVFARNPDDALQFGIECLERCFDGVGAEVTKVMHMCCGYPGHLDDEDYAKADSGAYLRLAGALDSSRIDQVSIEDAHRFNDLVLLESFDQSTVVFGAVAIATSRVEGAEDIARRLALALEHIDRGRLLAAPDCGLLMLDRPLAMAKLRNLCEAAASV